MHKWLVSPPIYPMLAIPGFGLPGFMNGLGRPDVQRYPWIWKGFDMEASTI